MANKLRLILFFLLLAASVVFQFVSCSPQKRMNRLVKNNPELAKTDTVRQNKELIAPGFKKDTIVNVNTDLSGLYCIIDGLRGTVDSLTRVSLKGQIKTYIERRDCFDGPVTLPFPHGGFITITQLNGKYAFHIEQPDRKINLSVPVVVMKVETVNHFHWGMFFGGFFTLALLEFCVILIWKIKIPI